jgi:hypothetical protein
MPRFIIRKIRIESRRQVDPFISRCKESILLVFCQAENIDLAAVQADVIGVMDLFLVNVQYYNSETA